MNEAKGWVSEGYPEHKDEINEREGRQKKARELTGSSLKKEKGMRMLRGNKPLGEKKRFGK